ncbi:hypothetical protein HDV04_002325 [Boothiomyces sp. JEL0838]|nr:hypothetical protein HDV04_002519 [Boothiomyces sp. JEL0838]KAJ3313164.1 hypothetical protein HDV04_002325 [Boothiomyces sp. JEL0838]
MQSLRELVVTKPKIAAVSAIIAYFCYKFFRQFLSPMQTIPGPIYSPLFPSFQAVAYLRKRKFFEYLDKLLNKYGKIFRFIGVAGESVVVTDAREAKRILTDTTEFTKMGLATFRPLQLLDYALFVLPSDDLWKRHRKLLQPAFGPTHLRHTAEVSRDTVLELEAKINSKLSIEKQVRLNMHSVLSCTTLDIIGKVAFGHSMGAVETLDDRSTGSWEDLDTITTKLLPFRMSAPTILWKLLGIDNSNPEFSKAKQNVDQLLQDLSNERLEKIRNKELIQEKWDMDVLHRLLISQNNGLMTKEEVFGELVGFFFAGHETTANTLTFVVLELCKNPGIEKRLFEEVKSIDFANDNLLEILPSLKFLDNIFKEAQRLHPVVPSLLRVTTQDTTIMGHYVPRNTRVVVNIRGIHQSSEYYSNPMEYNPDRWDTPPVVGSFLPFGDGQRNCIGQKMAVIEAKIILIGLIQKFTFQLDPNHPLDPTLSITYGLKSGMMAYISQRK